VILELPNSTSYAQVPALIIMGKVTDKLTTLFAHPSQNESTLRARPFKFPTIIYLRINTINFIEKEQVKIFKLSRRILEKRNYFRSKIFNRILDYSWNRKITSPLIPDFYIGARSIIKQIMTRIICLI
jgi:hypothetical protein